MKTVQLTLGVLALLAILPLAQAQSVPTNGTPPFNTFSGGPDVIDDGNLNIHFTIPVFSRAGSASHFRNHSQWTMVRGTDTRTCMRTGTGVPISLLRNQGDCWWPEGSSTRLPH